VQISYSAPDGSPAVNILNSAAILGTGLQRNDETLIAFPSPQVFLEERGFLNLNVTITGGVRNLMVYVFYR